MKAKITDYFTKNCKDAANKGHLWYAIDDVKNFIMYSMDNIVAYIVDYDARLHAIFEAVNAYERKFEDVYNILFDYRECEQIITGAAADEIEKYKYYDHTYLHIGDYMFDYDYIKRKIPKGNITFNCFKWRTKHIAMLVICEDDRACLSVISCAFKKVGLYG